MNEEKKSARIKAAALWRNRTRDGSEYLSGTWGRTRVLIFSNGFKRGHTDPDFYLYLAERQPAAQANGSNSGPNQHADDPETFGTGN